MPESLRRNRGRKLWARNILFDDRTHEMMLPNVTRDEALAPMDHPKGSLARVVVLAARVRFDLPLFVKGDTHEVISGKRPEVQKPRQSAPEWSHVSVDDDLGEPTPEDLEED